MALAPEDKYIVLTIAAQMFCARVTAGEDAPDPVRCAADAKTLYAAVDRHLAPTDRRKRERPPEVEIGAHHRG